MSLPRLPNPMIIQIFTPDVYVSNLFCFSLKEFQFSSQALNMEENFLNQMKPSQMVIKETPRNRLRVPPISATMVDEWYSSSSFSIEVYLNRVYLVRVSLNWRYLNELYLNQKYLDWAIIAKTKCGDLKEVGIPPPWNWYFK